MSRIHFAGVYTAEIQKKVTIKNRINEILHISQSLLVAPPYLKYLCRTRDLLCPAGYFQPFTYNSLIVAVIAILHIRLDGAWAAITAETKIKTVTTASNTIGKCHATPK